MPYNNYSLGQFFKGLNFTNPSNPQNFAEFKYLEKNQLYGNVGLIPYMVYCMLQDIVILLVRRWCTPGKCKNKIAMSRASAARGRLLQLQL